MLTKTSKFFFFRNTNWLLILFLVLSINQNTAIISYIVLGIYALLSRVFAINAMVINFIYQLLIFNKVPIEYFYFSLGVSIFSILIRCKITNYLHFKNTHVSTFFIATILLCIFLILHSLVFSSYPIISILKSILWSGLSISLLIAFNSIAKKDLIEFGIRAYWIFFSLVFVSFILLLFDIGYSLDQKNFHGVFKHPQILGFVLSCLLVSTTLYLLERKNFSIKNLATILLIIFYIKILIMSGSRTAFFSYLFSLALFFLSSMFFNKYNFLRSFQFFSNKNSRYFFLFFFIFILLNYNFFINIYYEFSQKGQSINNIFEAYVVSRYIAYGPSIENIKSFWDTGIGLGIASTSDLFNFTTFFGIPISAPIEKGNLFIAAFEELGVLGFVIFSVWIFLLIRRVVIKKKNLSLILIFNVFFFNLGESVLFSVAGLGSLNIVLLFWSSSIEVKMNKINEKIN